MVAKASLPSWQAPQYMPASMAVWFRSPLALAAPRLRSNRSGWQLSQERPAVTTWLLWLNMALTGSMLMIWVSPKDSYSLAGCASAAATGSPAGAGASALLFAANSTPVATNRQTAGKTINFLFMRCSPCTDQASKLTFM